MIEKYNRDIIALQMQIVNEVTGAWKSQVMYTLLKLGVFDLLEKGACDAKLMAQRLNVPEESLKRLANCAVSLGYLITNDNIYSNSKISSKVLVSGKPGYLGNWLLLCDRWYDSFGKLDQAVKKNGSVENINYDDDPEYKDIFIKGMIDYAEYRGSDILNFLELAGKERLLDVGSGPAVYSAMFCEKYPDLKVTCADLPHALEVANDYLENKNCKERIELFPCDYKEIEDFGYGYDVVFMSHILHQEDKEMCRKIIKKGFNSLKPGGLFIVQAMFPDEKGQNSYTLLHDLLSLLIFPGGKNYSVPDIIHLMKDVGLQNVKYKKMSLFNINSLVIGEKK
ncbi:MAG: class I SAM-dependent methyltransferase [Ignavibacteria bacterium]|nr:class I SAM-dependent methyltransferase [Ignavibacteria bacterium]